MRSAIVRCSRRTRSPSRSSRATSGPRAVGRGQAAQRRGVRRCRLPERSDEGSLVTLISWHALSVDPTRRCGTTAGCSSAGPIRARSQRSRARTRTTTFATRRARCGKRSTSSRVSRRRLRRRLGHRLAPRPRGAAPAALTHRPRSTAPGYPLSRDAHSCHRCSLLCSLLDAAMTSASDTSTTAEPQRRSASTSSVTARSGPSRRAGRRVARLCRALQRPERRLDGHDREAEQDTGSSRPRCADDMSCVALSDAARAQIVYTADPVPSGDSVEINGALHTRRLRGADAPVLVESPLAVRARSRARSGSRARRTRSRRPSVRARRQRGECRGRELRHRDLRHRDARDVRLHHRRLRPIDGELVVFELSAEDGSRINEVEIPLSIAS